MAPSRKKKRSTPHRPLNGISPQGLRAADKDVLILWEDGIEKIKEMLQKALARAKPTPMEKRDSVIKVEVYRLVRLLSQPRFRRSFERVVAYKAEYGPRMKFSDNPYYWALAAVISDNEIELRPEFVSRYAIQMRYAELHNVHPEFLVGFIYQVGGISRIRHKLNRDEREDWYRADT